MDRAAHAGKQIVNALAGRTEHLEALARALLACRGAPGHRHACRRDSGIGDAAIDAGRYPF